MEVANSMQGTMQHTITMYWNYEFTVVVLEFVLPEETLQAEIQHDF